MKLELDPFHNGWARPRQTLESLNSFSPRFFFLPFFFFNGNEICLVLKRAYIIT